MGRTLNDINQSKISYDPPPREINTKTNNQDLIKIKTFKKGFKTFKKNYKQSKKTMLKMGEK